MLKLLQTGHAVATVEQLRALGLAKGIYPLLDLVVERADQPFVRAALQDTDRRVGEGKPVAPSFLLACVLWSDVRDGWASRLAQKQHPFPALQDAIDDVFNARIGDVSGRGKLGADMREIWMMQPRFEKRVGRTPFSLVEQPRFRAGFDFMRLRADAGEIDVVLADWWQEFSLADDAAREDLVAQVREEQNKGQRRVRVVKPQDPASPAQRPAAPSPAMRADDGPRPDDDPASGEAEEGGDGAPSAPRKRRRRRRKPAGAGGAAGTGGNDAPPPGGD
jgi:poly(A) polymerase